MGKSKYYGYPNKPLGGQKKPFDEAFSGFDMLRKHFAKRDDAKQDNSND